MRSEQALQLPKKDATGSLAGTRILMTADAVGGVWTYALDLAGGLVEQGAQVTLALLGPAPSPEHRHEADAVPGLELLETGLPLDWTAWNSAEILRAGALVADLAHEIGADLVHLNSPALAAEARFAMPLVGVCHSCVATWWAATRDAPLPPDFAWRTDLVARGYAASDALIAPTAAFAQATAEVYGIAAPTVVRNGRRLPPSPRLLGEEGTSRASRPDLFVFTAGRLWDEGKNLALLDEAAAQLSVPVMAAGPTEGPNGARIALHHLQPLGRLGANEIAQRLAARPIFVSPARYEPFGLAVLEAAQAGCPLVLSDIPTFRELWDDGAIFVRQDDAGALAAAIETLVAEPTLRRNLGEAACERAARYSVGRMIEGTTAVYCEVLAGRAPHNRAPLSESLAS
jgi:glycogen(starch) synthase